MDKTISFIQAFDVNGGRPKNAARAYPIVVRPPQNMKCFRATITINNNDGNDYSQLYISTSPVTNGDENSCLILGTFSKTDNTLDPAQTYYTQQSLVLDRRAVGYMADELYFYADFAKVIIVWEGIISE